MKKFFSVFLFFLLLSAGVAQAQDSVWVNVLRVRCDDNPAEQALLTANSNAGQAGGWRYADGTKMAQYHLNLNWFADLAQSHQLYFRAYIWNEYYIKVSQQPITDPTQGYDFGFYNEDYDTSKTMRDASNQGWHDIDLSLYINDYGWSDIYVTFFDGRPQDGWGPSIPYISVAYYDAKANVPYENVDVTFTKSGHYTVDGSFDEWLPETQWVDVKKGEANILETGTVSANFGGKAAIAFVDTAMYVAAEVTDAAVTDNDKVILYIGNYDASDALNAGHKPFGDVPAYRTKKEPDYRIEIPLKDGEFMKESAIVQTDTLVGNFKVVKTATGYSIEAEIPFSSLYVKGVTSNKYTLFPSPVPDIYNVANIDLPRQPFAFQLVDGGNGSLLTAFDADVDENPSSWALVTNTLNKFPFEHFTVGPTPFESMGLRFYADKQTAVTVPNPGVMLDTNTGKLTMEAWIYAPEWRGSAYQGCVINREDDYTYTLRVGGGGRINANIQNQSGDVQTPSATEGATMELNQWYHIAVVVDSTYSKIYVNGDLAQTDSAYYFLADPAQYPSADSTLDLVFGNSQAYPSRGFTGVISDVRMWNVPRSQEQVKADMAGAPTAAELASNSLIGYWPLNEGAGQVANDLSKFKHNGYLGQTDAEEETDPVWSSTSNIGTEDEPNAPTTFNLAQNYPNPFNPTTNIQYTVPAAGMVKLTVYNILGQEVRTLVNEVMSAGTHQVMWRGDNNFGQRLSSGVYLYRIDFNNTKQMVKKMIMLK